MAARQRVPVDRICQLDGSGTMPARARQMKAAGKKAGAAGAATKLRRAAGAGVAPRVILRTGGCMHVCAALSYGCAEVPDELELRRLRYGALAS